MTEPPDHAVDDPAAVELLEAYLAELQAGRRPEHAQFVAALPQLERLLACLDSLDRLVPEARPTVDLDATLPLDPRGLPASSPGALGSDFGKYELLAELGRGGMGVVYKARQKDLDRIVALKMILGSQLAPRGEVERFQNEAKAAARLRHPNIVQVFEAGELAGQHYFAMQFIDGQGFDELLAKNPPPLDVSVRILGDITRAVAYLHQQGIVHRDLKPSNIMLEIQTQIPQIHADQPLRQSAESAFHFLPRLTDFGLAKILEGDARLTRTGAVVGTPSYMAPEQAAGGKEIGPACDVYSLGAILYEVLTSRPPFREATPLDTLVQVIEGEPTLPRQLNVRVPRELELVCLKCLEKEPERRYPSATALADDLERYLNGEAVEARPQGLWQHFQRWARREPALASRLIGLGVVAAVAEVTFLINPHSQVALHYLVLGVFGLWALLSWVCQRLLRREAWNFGVKAVWSCAEPFLLASLLWLTDGANTVLVIAFPIQIASTGLWFQVRLVWLNTIAALIAFGLLIVASPPLQVHYHHSLIYLVCLALLSAIVAHQIERMRVLSKHYSNRSLP